MGWLGSLGWLSRLSGLLKRGLVARTRKSVGVPGLEASGAGSSRPYRLTRSRAAPSGIIRRTAAARRVFQSSPQAYQLRLRKRPSSESGTGIVSTSSVSTFT